jgi:poly-gamma-glutamate capsule biosynthesis protein CapA/YwtB (metallophosphatase superfamily)
MRGWLGAACVAIAACHSPGAVRTEPARTGDVSSPQVVADTASVPGTAAASIRNDCPSSGQRGTWRYALIAPLHTAIHDITSVELKAMLRGTSKRQLAMSAATRAVLDRSAERAEAIATPAGTAAPSASTSSDEALRPTDQRWAIVPAHELTPHWHVITVDGVHPLAKSATGPLAIPVCGEGNIAPDAITTVAMTGVTAMTRFTADLMERKGITYPARDVEAWLAATDFVHVSNEVAFVSSCETKPDRNTRAFCSRDEYIELLSALHADIVELTGSHVIDFGTSQLRHSIEIYVQAGLRLFGGGRDQLAATRPLLVEHAGNKLAFLGCNRPRSTAETIRNGPNVAFCDFDRLDWQLADLRSRGYVPLVSIQHEEVRGHTPAYTAVRDFRRLAEAGAAAVFGSQAHVAHPFEVHAGAYVHYGAGNFIFDQPWRSTRDGIADRFYIHRGKLLTVERLYTRIEEMGRPRPMTDSERTDFLRTLDASRAELTSPARPFAPQRLRATAPIPDSFLVGKLPVYLEIAASNGAYAVKLRKPTALPRKRLLAAIRQFIVAKYSADENRVSIR